MSEQITITLPAIDETIIETIERETVSTHDTETLAVAALRVKYATLARQNGYIKTSYSYRENSNYRNETETFYTKDGRKVRALLVIDDFGKEYDDQNRGSFTGSRLYLTQHGAWVEVVREGNWSAWQGEPEGWMCGESAADDEYSEIGGSLDVLTDEQVISNYKLADIVSGLSESLKTLAEKLPERLAKVQQRASLASQLLASLK